MSFCFLVFCSFKLDICNFVQCYVCTESPDRIELYRLSIKYLYTVVILGFERYIALNLVFSICT